MSDLNLCIFTGRLGADPEMKATKTDTSVVSIRIAVGGRKKVGEQWEETTDWIPVVLFGRAAEVAQQYLRKGSFVRITGRYSARQYEDQSGQKKTWTEIAGNEMQMLDKKGDNAQGGAPQQQSPGQGATQANMAAQAPAGVGPDFSDIPFRSYMKNAEYLL